MVTVSNSPTTQPGQAVSAPTTPLPPTAAFNELSDGSSALGSAAKDDQLADPLINALAVLSVPGIQGQPYLFLHVSNSNKKCTWAGQFIDLAYLLEIQLVPEDSKSYEFACSNSTNPNGLSF